MSILSKAPLISKFVKITLNDMIVGRKHVFGIHLTPPFHHFCTNSVSSLNEQEPIKENPHTNIRKNYKGKLYKQADLATSIEYFNSDVFRNTYKGKPVWFYYRRNYKGHFPSSITRKNCVHFGKFVSSNPCPICRDEYLVLSHRHIELLKQFINPDTLEIFPLSKTGICRHQYKILQHEVEKARDLGLIQTWLPFYLYNYHDYYDYLPKDQLNELLKINNSQLTHQDAVISSNDIASLPLDIQEILKANQSIPHTEEFTIQLPEINIDRPKLRVLHNSLLSKEGNLYQRARNLWTSINEGHGPLYFIAPQTRLRVVDNSPWSSIAPTTHINTGKDQPVKKVPNIDQKLSKPVKDMNDVSNLLSLGSKVLSIKPAKCIRVYNKRNKGTIGDKVLVAVNGEMKKGWIVGARLPSVNGWPRFDSNNVVLIDNDGNPLGTRILVPVPARLRSLSGDITKILSIASSFV
ncbi:unnamed protein product [Schistosoma intercalatum]|nr:unnamed protein product [Schistosoma intercalatum]CAH8437766.1 unnamed protein product [Schistosoma intercalatum]